MTKSIIIPNSVTPNQSSIKLIQKKLGCSKHPPLTFATEKSRSSLYFNQNSCLPELGYLVLIDAADDGVESMRHYVCQHNGFLDEIELSGKPAFMATYYLPDVHIDYGEATEEGCLKFCCVTIKSRKTEPWTGKHKTRSVKDEKKAAKVYKELVETPDASTVTQTSKRSKKQPISMEPLISKASLYQHGGPLAANTSQRQTLPEKSLPANPNVQNVDWNSWFALDLCLAVLHMCIAAERTKSQKLWIGIFSISLMQRIIAYYSHNSI